ncbi:unnamed protein product [Blepharisma stoltei]|uniref:Uncharacterized protein n=1 Tax=Blepharisma stoltei TaxID=1481888 RepID=A0AAU9J414_9CILI|nr:unnamed protein product [Blepharisma stoltei]
MENGIPAYKSEFLKRIELSLKEKEIEHTRQVSFSKTFKDLFEVQRNSGHVLHNKAELPRHMSTPRNMTFKELPSRIRQRDSPRVIKSFAKIFSPNKLEIKTERSLLLNSSLTKVSFGKMTPQFSDEGKEPSIHLSPRKFKIVNFDIISDHTSRSSKSIIKERHQINSPRYHVRLPKLSGISPRLRMKNL